MCQKVRPARHFAPTTAQPGTPEKVAVLAARRAAGLPLWHPEDPVLEGATCARQKKGRDNPMRGIRRTPCGTRGRRTDTWQVRVGVGGGRRRVVGHYRTLEEAVAARDAAEAEAARVA